MNRPHEGASDNKGVSGLTNKQIRHNAFQNIEGFSDTAAESTVCFFTTVVFITLIELGIVVFARMAGYHDYMPFSVNFYKAHRLALTLAVMRLAVYGLLLSTLSYFVCRNFMSFTFLDKNVRTNKFLYGHIRRLIIPCLRNSVSLFFLKVLTASPAAVSGYLMVKTYRTGVREELAMWELFCFMLATGFTIVWISVTIHYHMSLCLVPYISRLNPRASFFAACDLSVKLMEGRHMRVFSFMLSIVPALLSGVLFYPLLIVYPFVTECRILLAREIMGAYWQDKIPAMVRRWEKQLARMEKQRGRA